MRSRSSDRSRLALLNPTDLLLPLNLHEAFTGDSVAYSSVQQWVTSDLTELLTDICGYLGIELGRTESALEGRFEHFQDVFISDGTICTLSAESFEEFPRLGDDHAGAKLHVIESLASRAPIFSSITDARTQETTQFQISDWVEDSLLLFDLGYLDYARLARIERNDGWFVSRLNVDANPEIIDELRTWRGDSIDLEGRHLQEVLPDLYRQIIDSTGTIGADQDDPHLPYDVRVVGVRHEDDEDNHRTEEVKACYQLFLYVEMERHDMMNSSQSALFPEWNGPHRCPFCQYELDNGGEAFIRHVDANEECRKGFDRWRINIAGDMKGEWTG